VRDRSGTWLLFDNQTDPYQKCNLVNETGAAEVQRNLKKALVRKLKKAGDKFLSAEEYIRKWGYVANEHGTVPYPP
jgi:hypothetical protein